MAFFLNRYASRYSAIAILVLAVLFPLCSTLFFLYDSLKETQDEITQQNKMVTHYQATLDNANNLAPKRQQITDEAYANLFFENIPYNSAAARIQCDLKKLIDSNNGNIRKSQATTETQDNALSKVNVHLSFSIPAQILPALLEEIKKIKPFIFFDEIEIKSTKTVTESAHKQTLLNVEANLFAYLYVEAK
jgi:hypothetical protein